MTKDFIALKWDSNFFGFPVAKLNAGKVDLSILKYLFFFSDIKLIYFFTDDILPDYLSSNIYFEPKLVDKKISIRKTLNKNAKLHAKVEEYRKNTIDCELLELAHRAGSHSRFCRDEYISNSKCKRLYEIWLKKSIQGELADTVLVYKEDSKIVGFISVNTGEDEPHVTLLAVDSKVEGKWVSYALMTSVESVLVSKGFKSVWSETQQDNIKAISAYKRHGLEFGDLKYVYHFWRKDI